MKIALFLTALAILAVGSVLAGSEKGKNRAGLTVKETFELYSRAVQNSDLEALFSTVTEAENMIFLTATGAMIDSRQGYYEFHRRWFAESGWEMPVELIETREGEDFGYAIARFDYRQKIPEGSRYELDSYFMLVFHKENGMWKVVADVCSPIDRFTTEDDTLIKYDSRQGFLFETMANRRTVRKFKPDPVPEEHIIKILDAARFAPTSGNQQPWKFLVVRDRERLDQLRDSAVEWLIDAFYSEKKKKEEEYGLYQTEWRERLEDILSAPVYVAVLADSEARYPDYVVYDGTLAAGYLMIAARALGYGTGYFTTFFPEEKMKDFFDIPGKYKLICFTPIGVPESWPQRPDKKPLEEMIVFEQF